MSHPAAFSEFETKMKYARSGKGLHDREVVCGPLLNYRHMENNHWHGSVLLVTSSDGDLATLGPTLLLRRSVLEGVGDTNCSETASSTRVQGYLLHYDGSRSFWRFDLSIKMKQIASRWEYIIEGVNFLHRTRRLPSSFVIPSYNESMRIMFYSCNGWCDDADKGEWNHLSLWKDVLRQHGERAFHVMIGGGDQIYSDGVYTSGPLLEWTQINDPQERLEYQCTPQLYRDIEAWYLDNYIQWYSTEPFASALCQIPSLNIWDDHDIIDGFGSYDTKTMECSVFKAIGAVAHKYYMLFQHHLPPWEHNSVAEPQYVLGPKPGPYIQAPSHSIFTKLGARIAFLGVDARTERTREQTNYRETYDRLFARVDMELDMATRSDQPIKHLILLFGIPLAYPPLTWVENAFTGSAGRSFQRLSDRLNIGKNTINKFDGAIELLDDLNDHYTSAAHQDERRHIIEQIQCICARHSVRATILSGDVHLAAVGRFFSSHKQRNVPPIEEDFRFMNNIISSAIVNQPPPLAMARLIAQADKIRNLNTETEESLFKVFRADSKQNSDPDSSEKEEQGGGGGTTVAIPQRNYTIITENSPNNLQGRDEGIKKISYRQFFARRGNRPLHFGEANAGQRHIAASAQHGLGNEGSLDVCICVEVNHRNRDGRTRGFGFSIPALECRGTA
ncbi:hypothetical protein AbraIFM66951_011826 [Aspergillus brasiliensis]|uniref:PhoD-like phosphatase domain-containing protein n=1 Tax=Aspergillus brasiliensis TaxID=319629 RepID=A0A9W6DRF3_9EURO|nr:hypothetical protein AbraCBS73388_011756 [Aspergillus brasiliensis]GKZ48072.1 hypothetical protein AbraIFM66951_011826 [Aspergillus brasiliensis]